MKIYFSFSLTTNTIKAKRKMIVKIMSEEGLVLIFVLVVIIEESVIVSGFVDPKLVVVMVIIDVVSVEVAVVVRIGSIGL